MKIDHFAYRFLPATTPGLPTLVLLHGTGGNEDSLGDLGAEVMPGAACLSPRGLVLEHGMPRFFRRFAEGQFDLEDLAFRTSELTAWLAVALAHHGAVDAPIVFFGYSNGANMAAALLMAGIRADVAVLLRPMFVHRPAQIAPMAGTRVLISSGARDRITPPESATQLAELLREHGAAVEQVIFEEAGHDLLRVDIERATRWLRGLTETERLSPGSR